MINAGKVVATQRVAWRIAPNSIGKVFKKVGGFLGSVLTGEKQLDLSGITLPTFKTESKVSVTPATQSFLKNIGFGVVLAIVAIVLIIFMVKK